MESQMHRFVTAAALMLCALPGSARAQVSFRGLGFIAGGDSSGAAFVAPHGNFAVGSANSAAVPDREAAVFPLAGAPFGLGTLPTTGMRFSEALGASDAGDVVVGYSSSNQGLQAMRWTQGGGMVGLGDLPGGSFFSLAFGCSADGSIVVGNGSLAAGPAAFRWTQATGMTALPDLPGGTFDGSAMGCSAAGDVIVGRSFSGRGREACRWSGGTVVALGDLPGGAFDSYATGVSDDGATIVGQGASAS